MKCKNCKYLDFLQEKDGTMFPWCPIHDDCPDIEAERTCVEFEMYTNADHIRSLSDEELATIFCTHNWTLAQYSECLAWLRREVGE